MTKKKARSRYVRPKDIEDVIEPFPMGKRTPLSVAYPEVYFQWHYQRNCGFGPEDFSAGSGVKVWWVCDRGPDHVFKQAIQDHVTGLSTSSRGCPCCYGARVSVTNSLETFRPDLAEQVMPRKSGTTAAKVTKFSSKKLWWRCNANRNHTWQASVDARNGAQTGCPHCYSKDFGINLLTYPRILKYFDRRKNKGISPEYITTNQKIWWICRRARDHRWYAIVYLDQETLFCPFCRGRKPSSTNCVSAHRKLSKEFDLNKNKGLNPKNIVLGSACKIWWRCQQNSKHVWKARVADRTSKDYGCPFCSHQRVCPETSLASRFPAIAKQWDHRKNGELTPDTVAPFTKRRVWWRCNRGPDHEWSADIKERCRFELGCPYCTNQKVSITNSLATLFPGIATELDANLNNITAAELTAGSAKRVWWRCSTNGEHVWQTCVYTRTRKGSRCPECKKEAIANEK